MMDMGFSMFLFKKIPTCLRWLLVLVIDDHYVVGQGAKNIIEMNADISVDVLLSYEALSTSNSDQHVFGESKYKSG
jgi:hypothetical protein